MQDDCIGTLNADTVNTMRVITMRDSQGEIHIPFSNIRIGRKGMCVDNFCSGGMTAGIDINTGVVCTPAVNGKMEHFTVHPDSGVDIVGFRIPHWGEVKSTVTRAADRLPNCRYIGWDVVISQGGRICLIEGNSNPEARIHQLVLGKGLRDVYRKYLGDF